MTCPLCGAVPENLDSVQSSRAGASEWFAESRCKSYDGDRGGDSAWQSLRPAGIAEGGDGL